MADPYGIRDRVILDTGDSPLEVSGGALFDSEGHGIGVTELDFPRPEVQQTWAGSRHSEGEVPAGEPRYMNRKIHLKLWVWEGRGVGAATNLVTNPSFEVDTAGWATSGGALTAGGTMSREQSGVAGEWSGQLVAGGANHGLGITATLDAGETYKLRFAARKTAGSVASLSIARASTTLGSVTLSTDWQMFEITVPGAAGAQFMSWRANAAGTFQVDSVLLTTGTPLYFDGDTPGCKWSGTAHASTSERVGSGEDLKRALKVLSDLEAKLEKLTRQGGTIRRYLPDGSHVTFDVVDATYPASWQRSFAQGKQEFEIELTCRPFGRLPSITRAPGISLGSSIAYQLDQIPGTAPGLLRLAASSPSRRGAVIAGLGPAAPATITATSRALSTGTSIDAVGPGGNINGIGVAKTVAQSLWRPMFSTTTSGGTRRTDTGSFRVFARVWPTRDSTFKLEWSQADLVRWTENPEVTANAGGWTWIDLGEINLTPPTTKPWGDSKGWRWEGRVSVITPSATGSDYVYTDAIHLLPTEYGACELQPLDYQPAGGGTILGYGNSTGNYGDALAGKAAVVGGNWAQEGSGSGNFTIASDPPSGRYIYRRVPTGLGPMFALIGSATPTGVQGSFSVWHGPVTDTVDRRTGVVTRYSTTSKFLVIAVRTFGSYLSGLAVTSLWVALYSGTAIWGGEATLGREFFNQQHLRVNYSVSTAGDVEATLRTDSGAAVAFTGNRSELATGGSHVNGKIGIYDNLVSGQNGTFAIHNPEFQTHVATTKDAVIYPNRNLLVTSDNAIREDSTGTSYGAVGRYRGDRLTVPARQPAALSILHQDEMGQVENTIPTLSSTLTVIPRVVDVPDQ